jgi:hypothetical protein
MSLLGIGVVLLISVEGFSTSVTQFLQLIALLHHAYSYIKGKVDILFFGRNGKNTLSELSFAPITVN